MNGVIRNDKKDVLGLRFPMRRTDIEIIRAAGREDTDTENADAVKALLVKTKRDAIYSSFYVSVGKSS